MIFTITERAKYGVHTRRIENVKQAIRGDTTITFALHDGTVVEFGMSKVLKIVKEKEE